MQQIYILSKKKLKRKKNLNEYIQCGLCWRDDTDKRTLSHKLGKIWFKPNCVTVYKVGISWCNLTAGLVLVWWQRISRKRSSKIQDKPQNTHSIDMKARNKHYTEKKKQTQTVP